MCFGLVWSSSLVVCRQVQKNNLKVGLCVLHSEPPRLAPYLLFNRNRDSSEVMKVSDEEFKYCHASVVGAKVPTWVILTPKVVPPVDNIDMDTGASIGFFGPTNKENSTAQNCTR